jgi:cytochrome c biogenesis protein CcmG/thiol:disulfide interchange protein DsbE
VTTTMRWVLVGSALALGVAASIVLFRAGGSGSPGLMDKTAPPLAGRTLDGAHYRWVPGRSSLTIVNVWASWCGPCREELPTIARFAHESAAAGIAVVAVDTRDGPVAARTFLDQIGVSGLTTLVDETGRTAVEWGVTGVPETFVVDRDGVVRAHAAGPVDHSWLLEQATRVGAP